MRKETSHRRSIEILLMLTRPEACKAYSSKLYLVLPFLRQR